MIQWVCPSCGDITKLGDNVRDSYCIKCGIWRVCDILASSQVEWTSPIIVEDRTWAEPPVPPEDAN